MSGSELLTTKRLKESCDNVESILQALREHTDNTLTNRSKTLPLVKTLFTSLQKLEDDGGKADGAFHTADSLARQNLSDILAQCLIVAGQLRIQINSNTLRHDDKVGRQLTVLSNKIENFFLKSASTSGLDQGPTSDSTTLVEDLLREQRRHQSVVEELEGELRASYELHKILQRQIDDRDSVISELESRDDAKLSHIRRLHRAISNLNSRHHMPYQINDWDDLAIELPSMVQKIEDIDVKLKEFEVQRDRLNEQEYDSEDESIGNGVPRAPKPPPALNRSKVSNKGKAKEGDKDAKKKEYRAFSELKPSIKVRSPSPTASEATSTKTVTGKATRKKSRIGNQRSLFGT